MEFRLLKEEDYDDTLVKWWDSWGFTAPPKSALPDNGLGGYMVSSSGIDVCAGFLYQTNSKIAWCEWIVSSKEYKEKDRAEALTFLIDIISLAAKEQGYTSVFTSVRSKPLINKYKKSGYKIGNTDCTEMIKIL